MIVLAAIFMMLALGRVILYLTDGTKVVWDSVQVLGLLSWVIGAILAARVLGWLPTITFG